MDKNIINLSIQIRNDALQMNNVPGMFSQDGEGIQTSAHLSDRV